MHAIDEVMRLAAVRRYEVLDAPREEAFDRITTHAARLLNVPIALMTVIDEQRIWVKSSVGTELQSTDRLPGFCASCILQDEGWVIPDAEADPRTRTHPLVTGPFGLRFYVGVPLRTFDGCNIGTLCCIDRVRRSCTAEESAGLTDLAAMMMDDLELRLAAKEARAAYATELMRREQREERITALNRELAHRAKNLMALVLSIIRQTAAGEPPLVTYFDKLSHRVQALADTYDVLIDDNWQGASIADLAKRHINPFLQSPEQLRLTGPDILVNAAAAQSFGLAFHELASNSARHGALSGNTGTIALSWTVDRGRSELSLTWEETHASGPPPASKGFGHLVLERLAPQALEGQATFSAEQGRAVWTLCCPLVSTGTSVTTV